MTDTGARKKTPVSYDLAHFERLAGDGDPLALPMLRQVLDHIEEGGDLSATGGNGAVEIATETVCMRFANAITELFQSADLDLPPEDCDWLALHNRHLAAIFRLAWPDGPDRVFRRVRDAHGNPATGDALRKVLAAATIAANTNLDWRQLLEREPETAVAPFLGNFGHRALLDVDADERRNALFALAPLLAGIPLRSSALQVLSQAWMQCSYATAPDRHSLKPHLNAMVGRMLGGSGVEPAAPGASRPREDRPTIVVVADVLFTEHAVYKAYAFFLSQLRPRFRVLLVTVKGQTDEAAAALFDETFAVQWSAGAVLEIINKIKSLRPAILYYPAVGMSVLTVVLCNLRLAPIQIASTGHAATTHAPEIDYMVTGHEHFGGEEYFSERVVLLRSGGALFVAEKKLATPVPEVREAPDTLRIAVPDSPMKLNARFINLCRRVAAKSERPLEFWFFPNLVGIRYRDIRCQIEARIDNAVVHPRLDFQAYLDRLNLCDLRFGSFPVGGGTSSADAFRQGLPSLVFEGPEPHSRTDKRFIHLFALPDWLIAADEAEYERAALRLVGSDDERTALAREILDADPEAMLFTREQALYPTDFVDTFSWIYENHEHIQDTEKRAWTWEDRQQDLKAFGGDSTPP